MNLKNYFFRAVMLVAVLFLSVEAYAQGTIKGVVYDSDGKTPAVGVTVVVKGTNNGTSTNVDGTYSITTKSADDVLVFNFIGYEVQEFVPGSRTTLDVTMRELATNIDSVVVTALGLTRSEKSVGYAISQVDNEALTSSVASNWINNMNGKVAGLSMSSAGTGPGGTVRVTLRGDSSLNYGSNEALFVIDGIPVISGTVASGSGANYANNNAPVDFGNSVADLNPDDIESVSVLKGPAASALYGSLAQNGVILITTKSGRETKGFGVSFSSTCTLENAGFFPDFQGEYGPSNSNDNVGTTDQYVSAWGLPASMTEHGVAVQKNISRYSFGEKYDASKMRYLYHSKNWETGEFDLVPWVYAEDWYTGFFKTGVTWTNSVSVDGSTGKGTSARFSFTDNRNQWIMPNTGYEQQNYSLNVNQKLSKHIRLQAKVNYTHKKSDNMPMSGYSNASPMYGLIWGYTAYPMKNYYDEYYQGRYTEAIYNLGNGKDPYDIQSSLVYNSKSGHNPYRVVEDAMNTIDRDRVYGNIVVGIDIIDGLTLDLRGGMDMSVDFRTQGQPFMSADYATGMYREKTVRQYEYSMDFLLKYNNLFLDERLGLTAAVGANRLSNKYASTTIDAPELGINGPGMYTMANSAVALEVSPYRSRKEIQSVYGFVNLSWDDTYFLDVTARNDWSSTLHPTKWSYFYPSVSASILLDNLFKIRSNDINMIKLRGSWANVGNDTGVYSLYPDYSGTSFPGSVSLPSTLPNAYIEPENCESWEIGLDTKFFGNRLGVDIALYQNTTTNQIISAAQSAEIGNTSMKINAGKIRNRGIEVTVNATPVKTRNWTWNINANWAYNQNMLLALTDEWDPATPLQASTSTTIGGRTYIYSYVGQEMYQLYGKDYNRAPEGSYYIDDNGNKVDCSGAILINPSTGYPSLTSKPDQHIARVTPRWKAGLNTSITWKDLTLSAQFTAQMGGNAFSVTNFALSYQGKLKNSLEGRTDGMVLDGVVATADVDAEGNTVYAKNTTITENAQVYYNTIKWVRDNTRENTFSTDFFKLRELRLDYRFPAKLLAKTKVIQGLSVGVFATNVFCITDWPQYDPEAAGLVNGTSIYPGVETGTFPMTRTYGFNVKIQF